MPLANSEDTHRTVYVEYIFVSTHYFVPNDHGSVIRVFPDKRDQETDDVHTDHSLMLANAWEL
jgi:hypothetical protein